MRKIFLLVLTLFIACTAAFAAKVPSEVQKYITKEIPNTDIRFDGVITLPDGTVYLPVFPSLFSDVKSLKIKQTFPDNKSFKQVPDIVIFNNDFVLLKVITDGQGHKTVLHVQEPPLEVRTGLLPQDMLVPSGLIIPENIQGIIGNLKIDTKSEDIIRVNNEDSFEEFLKASEPLNKKGLIPLLKNKTLYVTTNYSKNVQVLTPPNTTPDYSLAQKSIPIDVKAVNKGKFLLVTTYERPFLDIISVTDSRFIKQIALNANPEQIMIDYKNNKAYIASPASSTIFVIDLDSMSLVQKIKINGYCEHMILSSDKLFYVDKLQNEIWAIELKNDYELKDIGNFPNVSSLAYINKKLYISSRTKSRIAVVDYDTLGLINEFTTVNKPLSMLIQGKYLYVLGSQNNEIQVINTDNNSISKTISLNTGGFSAGLKRIENTEYAIVTDLKNNFYSIIDLLHGTLVETYPCSIPLKDVIIADRVRLMD